MLSFLFSFFSLFANNSFKWRSFFVLNWSQRVLNSILLGYSSRCRIDFDSLTFLFLFLFSSSFLLSIGCIWVEFRIRIPIMINPILSIMLNHSLTLSTHCWEKRKQCSHVLIGINEINWNKCLGIIALFVCWSLIRLSRGQEATVSPANRNIYSQNLNDEHERASSTHDDRQLFWTHKYQN